MDFIKAFSRLQAEGGVMSREGWLNKNYKLTFDNGKLRVEGKDHSVVLLSGYDLSLDDWVHFPGPLHEVVLTQWELEFLKFAAHALDPVDPGQALKVLQLYEKVNAIATADINFTLDAEYNPLGS